MYKTCIWMCSSLIRYERLFFDLADSCATFSHSTRDADNQMPGTGWYGMKGTSFYSNPNIFPILYGRGHRPWPSFSCTKSLLLCRPFAVLFFLSTFFLSLFFVSAFALFVAVSLSSLPLVRWAWRTKQKNQHKTGHPFPRANHPRLPGEAPGVRRGRRANARIAAVVAAHRRCPHQGTGERHPRFWLCRKRGALHSSDSCTGRPYVILAPKCFALYQPSQRKDFALCNATEQHTGTKLEKSVICVVKMVLGTQRIIRPRCTWSFVVRSCLNLRKVLSFWQFDSVRYGAVLMSV